MPWRCTPTGQPAGSNWPIWQRSRAAPNPTKPALLRIALQAIDKAQSLDDLWPAEDARKFKPQDRAQLQELRRQLTQRLRAASPPS